MTKTKPETQEQLHSKWLVHFFKDSIEHELRML